MFIIKHTNGKVFEQDFAGWSWQADVTKGYKFKTKEEAVTVLEGLHFWTGERLEDMVVETFK